VKQCIKESREMIFSGNGQIIDEESLIDWGKVSGLMGHTRSRIQCRDKWVQLKDREEVIADDPVAKMPISETWRIEAAALEARLFSAKEKLSLLRAIRDSNAAGEGKIPWQTIKDELHGEGKRMSWKYCFRKLRESVPNHEKMDFKDVVAYLVDAFEEAAPEEPGGFDLPIEIFASSQNTKQKAKHRKRLMEDAENIRSFSTKRKPSGRQPTQSANEEAEIAAASNSSRSRKFRDRMIEDDSQASTARKGKSASADVEDVAQGFESIKRTPTSAKSAGKLIIRTSKRNKFLSEEKVIEDLSDDEQPRVNGDDIDMAGSAEDPNDDEARPVDSVNGDEMSLDDVEDSPEPPNDEDDYALPAARYIEGSPDLDTPVRGRAFDKKLGSPIHLNGFDDEVSSDDDMSDIPARRLPRMESLEL